MIGRTWSDRCCDTGQIMSREKTSGTQAASTGQATGYCHEKLRSVAWEVIWWHIAHPGL